MTLEQLKKKLNISVNGSIEKSDVLFFTGAGISAPDPCSFPLGRELHEILLHYYSDMTSWEIDDLFKKNVISFEKTVEIILDQFGKLDDQNDFFNLLTEIFIYREHEDWKEQNDYHKFFRDHILHNGKHITVNIDQFIELEDREKIQVFTPDNINEQFSMLDGENFLLKLHGDSNMDSIGLQGFLHRVIKNGFSEQVKRFLDRQIKQVKVIVFVGYGGVDEFDVTPYFEEKFNCFFKDTKALWINYSKDDKYEVYPYVDLPKVQQMILSKFGDSYSVKCSPEFILNNLFGKDSFKIENAHRRDGYRRQYENLFRINSFNEATSENGNKLKEYMQRRRIVREMIVN